MSLTKQQHLELYYWMQLNRRLENLLTNLFRQNKLVGGLYSSLGQEAISVGTAYALEERDWIAPMIRNIGALLVKGFKPRDTILQYMARKGSPTQGKDGTSHFGDLQQRRVISPISMLGDLIPVLTGVGLAARYLGRQEVALTWIGEGGSSTGVFHEGLNFAAVQKAPLVVVLENNLWAYSTPTYLQAAIQDFADRAKAYGIPGLIVDGNDVVAVYEVTKSAVERARRGEGPTLIEAKTFRRKGHAQHDPADYVPPRMREEWEAKDPLVRYERTLDEQALWSETEKNQILERIDKELEEELAAAEASPFPEPEDAIRGVYCEGCHDIRAIWSRSPEELRSRGNFEARWYTAPRSSQPLAAAPAGSNPGHKNPSRPTQPKPSQQSTGARRGGR